MGHMTVNIPLLGVLCYQKLEHDIVHLSANFDNSSFSHSRDMVGVLQNLNHSCDLTTPLSGIICHPRARTCYD